MIKKNFQTILLLLAAGLIISLVSCDPSKKYERQERNDIQDYLGTHTDLNFQLQPSGLYYFETLTGTGITPVLNDSAFVKYTGKFLNGYTFDSNVTTGTLFGFRVGVGITGFSEGIMLMKAGGKATLLIPSNLAYGSQGSYPYISGYTPLLFDVELVRVKPAE
jgi:FKBP-type peptidyl-prolyl cis-trans isomerase